MTLGLSMLEQEIDSDIKDRQRLMLQIKTLHLRYRFNEKDEQMFLTYAIPAIYSIWEGFVQTAFRFYIQELNKLQLSIDELNNSILVFHLENRFPQFRQYPQESKKKESFFRNLEQFYTEKSIEISVIVNTESNVGFKVLNKRLKDFNLQTIPDYIEAGCSLSGELEKFLITRNAVAHGQGAIIVNRDDLEKSIKLIERLMALVLEKIKEGFLSKSFLKNETSRL